MVNSGGDAEDLGPLPFGDYHMYRKRNEAGGWTYFSDELGQVLYDNCISKPCDVLAAVTHCIGQEMKEACHRKG